MCGITALQLKTPSSSDLPSLLKQSLTQLQHRGYDGAGIALDSPHQIILKKGIGLIQDVLNAELMEELSNQPILSYGLAHTRYKTKGECTNGSSQPLINSKYDLCLIHNGQVESDKCLPDSIHILNLIKQTLSSNPTPNDIFQTIEYLFNTLRGSYSCVLMIHNFGLVIFRDLYGIRPMVYAKSSQGLGVASEDIALSELEIFSHPETTYRDVKPGECLIFPANTQDPISYQSNFSNFRPCIFEYIYLAHPDSTFNGIKVSEARKLLGQILAHKIRKYLHVDDLPDYIIPVPETSCPATHKIAQILEIPYLEAISLRKDRAKARTFILPTQEERIKAVSQKFEIIDETIIDKLKDKHIMIVDDSIVRGTTLQYIVKLFREKCQVKEITLASISPPVKYKNIYGIDIPDSSALIASRYENYEQIAMELGADQIIYQDLQTMLKAFRKLGEKGPIRDFEVSVFNGLYVAQ